MSEELIHRAVSDDGTEIVGTVHGHGPPLVLVHGAMDDGEVSWSPSLPYLADRFTCHVPSLRNRGRSGRSEDSSSGRLVEDVTAYATSIGEPVGLVGLSLGGAVVLGAAVRLRELTAVVVHEPAVMEAISEADLERMLGVVMQEAELAQQGRLSDAIRVFGGLVGNEQEVAALEDAGAFDRMGPNAPADLAVIEQGSTSQEPRGTDPTVLARVDAPLLVLQGDRSHLASWFHAGVRHVADHVPHAEVRELEGVGHLAPMVEPAPVADEIARFVAQVGTRT